MATLVMECGDGVDLSHSAKDRGALPTAKACDYALRAPIGLQSAHERGMVHRAYEVVYVVVTCSTPLRDHDWGIINRTAIVGATHLIEIGDFP